MTRNEVLEIFNEILDFVFFLEVTSAKCDEVQALDEKVDKVWQLCLRHTSIQVTFKSRSSGKVCAFNGHRAWVSNPRTLVTESEM